MHTNGVLKSNLKGSPLTGDREPPLVWDWDIEHADRKRERQEDAALRDQAPFEVDRRLLKDVVREKMGVEVGRIRFLSAVTLVNHEDLVARVARRFMPRLKTESEVATLSYLREKTTVPVPRIYHYDSNPWNRLGGEFILMSKAPGIPLSRVYHGLSYGDLVKLVKNLAKIILQLFAHRFTDVGSLYFGPDPRREAIASGTPTPKAALQHYSGFPFSPTLGPMSRSPSVQSVHTVTHDYHTGPIISWPFFGSNRGDLIHPTEMNRGPWSSTGSYLESCVQREIDGVQRENAGSSAPHRLHLDPDEVLSSRHHRLRAVPGDESDDSDEYNMEESDEEWEGPGSAIYRDYRRNQRSTFLVAHLNRREQAVKREMGRWRHLMERLTRQVQKEGVREEFALDCHDLSLENLFVDPEDPTTITCVIDWESTTTRPLWACAHVPSCLQSSPFVSRLFRKAVTELHSDPSFRIPTPPSSRRPVDPKQVCAEWLYWEANGARLRMAHRCAEWDGWEEGLVDSILGPEEFEAEWFKEGVGLYDHDALKAMIADAIPEREELIGEEEGDADADAEEVEETRKWKGRRRKVNGHGSGSSSSGRSVGASANTSSVGRIRAKTDSVLPGGIGISRTNPPPRPVSSSTVVNKVAVVSGKLPFIAEEIQKEKMLNTTGDICGGRGGELGRRLEAWLTVTGGTEIPAVQAGKAWSGLHGDGEHDHHEHEEEEHHVEGYEPDSRDMGCTHITPRWGRRVVEI
ncbi:hypothetical protein FA13DRAFT_1754691 [Coprinellus micaceus]|uniref:Aminoglycoside phosphotransferase domain-containing protein n=1 Tax=Coprinellus micaceus TaxID=71717 RepID=A0A4Y7TED7_COPMI|nr:hypothetical protein FA13DRAFT_1754691 [Coprinellus micaceus]